MSFNHNTDPKQTLGARLELSAVISCGGASPTISDSNIPATPSGTALAVSHPATGKYRLTFPTGSLPANPSTCNVQVSLGNTASSNSIILYDIANLSASSYVDFYVLTAGVAADLAAGTISATFTFKNSASTMRV